jgi:hypothetical protein
MGLGREQREEYMKENYDDVPLEEMHRMMEESSKYYEIKMIAHNTPNDMELGKKVRQLFLNNKPQQSIEDEELDRLIGWKKISFSD